MSIFSTINAKHCKILYIYAHYFINGIEDNRLREDDNKGWFALVSRFYAHYAGDYFAIESLINITLFFYDKSLIDHDCACT